VVLAGMVVVALAELHKETELQALLILVAVVDVVVVDLLDHL